MNQNLRAKFSLQTLPFDGVHGRTKFSTRVYSGTAPHSFFAQFSQAFLQGLRALAPVRWLSGRKIFWAAKILRSTLVHFEIPIEPGIYTSRTRTFKQYSAATLSGYVKSGHSRWLSSSVHVRLTAARSSDCSITYAYTIYSHIFTLLNFGGKSQNRVQWGKST